MPSSSANSGPNASSPAVNGDVPLSDENRAPPPEADTSAGDLQPQPVAADVAQDCATAVTLSSVGDLVSAAPSAVLGSKIGPYELLEEIGEGGMGAVYKARHQHLDKIVAIKVLPLHGAEHHYSSISRFKREMKAVGRITHPNIVQAFDAGEIDGAHYLAMEYVEGCDLAKQVRTKGVFSVAKACETVRQAALALSAAHQAGLIHRDVKPSNLLMAKTGQVKLLDLGLALLGEDAGHRTDVTAAGQSFGTPDYMAPEQWEDVHTADARTDLYALGCTLFFLLVGRPPFSEEKYRNPFTKMNGHASGPIPDLKAACPAAPNGVVAIYRKLMAKAPADRYQTANQLIEALSSSTSSKSTPSTPPSQLSPSVVAADFKASAPHRPSPHPADVIPADRQPASRKTSPRWRTILIAPLALVAVGLGAVMLSPFFWQREPITTENLSGPRSSDPQPTGPQTSASPSAGPQPTVLDRQVSSWHGWPADAPKPAIAPFDAVEAKKYQEAWAKYLKVDVEYENTLGMKFVLIPPGEFTMWSTPEEIETALKNVGADAVWQGYVKSEAPRHKVVLTQPIYLGVHEVTQAQYGKVMGTNPSWFATTGPEQEYIDKVAGMDTSIHPVEGVSWNDAAAFCAKLSQQAQLEAFYVRPGESIGFRDGAEYRLPSEAEWEFACHAGTMTQYWIGDFDEDLTRVGWFAANSGGRTHAVGELKPNPFGL